MRKNKRVIPFTDYLAPLLDACPRCGGVGCKECNDRRLFLENTGYGYAPDDAIDMGVEDMEREPEDDEDDDGVDAIRRRKEREDESFARRLAQGVSMLSDADDSVLDD